MPSPFLDGGVIECHLETWESCTPHLVAELRKRMHVDDLISGKPTVPEEKKMKEGAIRIFEGAKFTLHKWHSNFAELEESERRGHVCQTAAWSNKSKDREQTRRSDSTLVGQTRRSDKCYYASI